MYPGGRVRQQPYSYSVPSPHRLFKNYCTELVALITVPHLPQTISVKITAVILTHGLIIAKK
jgi:hypothetical protein